MWWHRQDLVRCIQPRLLIDFKPRIRNRDTGAISLRPQLRETATHLHQTHGMPMLHLYLSFKPSFSLVCAAWDFGIVEYP